MNTSGRIQSQIHTDGHTHTPTERERETQTHGKTISSAKNDEALMETTLERFRLFHLLQALFAYSFDSKQVRV